jgi:hypothetical protein
MRNRPVILAALLLSGCLSPAATPSSSPSPTPSPSASPSPSESPSPTPTAAPTGAVFTNVVLGYRIDTPAPWRRSACLSTRDQSKPPAGDGFVRVPEQDEKGTDVGYVFDVVQVQVHPNPDRLTPERWLALGLIGGSATQSTEAATLDGHSALLLRSGPGLAIAYLVPIADRIYVVGYQNPPSDTSNVAEMDRMVRSFHLLTDQERAAAPSPVPVAARSAEAVADTLADGFARADADLLATVMAPCMAAAMEQAGGTFMPRGAFVQELRKAFAGGLTVTVQRRPIEKDATGTFIRATWNAAAEQQRDLYLKSDGDVWSWYLTLTRQPVR